ncbi:YggS family pyridoxal phosphate-dependent enzyme [Stella sp.]|uniref:YggS family pyridoxal phosphate-dependent enzyme n=1 Tax=Stella sp. TaxID=2912054 RepID=UPI0035B3BFE2
MAEPAPVHAADDVPDSIAARLAAVRRTIAEAARAAGRDPASVELVAVGKTYGAENMIEAIRGGQRVFGENRVQEAAAKWPDLKARWPDIRLHLIGPLQTNKVKDVIGLVDVLQTLDRESLAVALVKARDKGARLPALLLQVNTGREPQKAGVAPEAVDAFLVRCRDEWSLPVSGLMCIPPADEPPALHFALLREIARRNGLERLSMGMSGDYPTAIRFGATMVRVGSAIFGARSAPPA